MTILQGLHPAIRTAGALGVLVLPLVGLWWGHRHHKGVALASYGGLFLGPALALYLWDALVRWRLVLALDGVLLVSTVVFAVVRHRVEDLPPLERPWYGWALPVNALMGAPLLLVTLEALGLYNTPRALAVLAVYAFVLFAWSALDRLPSVTAVAAFLALVEATAFGWTRGGALVALGVFLGVSAVLAGAGVVSLRSSG